MKNMKLIEDWNREEPIGKVGRDNEKSSLLTISD